jgi:CO/xanthine dehydrogenase FAD-binding subunit
MIEAGKIIGQSKRYLTDLFQPVNDLLGSADYKLYLTQVLLQRGLEQAVQGNGGHASVG